MKHLYFLLVSIIITNCLFAQLNIDSLGHLDVAGMHNQNLNDIWGYVDENGNEYALVGGTKGTSIVDITLPSSPVEVQYIPGMESIWRDLKTWGDYAYVTTEALEGLLIIDLSPLPGGSITNTSIYTGPLGSEWQSAHNLYIDSAGYCYVFGANRGNGGVIILDLNADPMNPVEVGTFDNWYVHDGFVDNDTMYVGNISEGWISIVDVQDRSNPILLGTANTPSNFSHNVWASDGHYAYTTDEVSGGYIGSFDISDPSNIIELDRIQSSPGAGVIPHNTHVYQNYIVTSYYSDGVTIHDVTYPYNLIEIGNFDTYPGQTMSYDGCWGVFPFFPSGKIVASDITGGLFILGPNYTQAAYLEGEVTDASTFLPISQVSVTIDTDNQIELTDNVGFYATGIAIGDVYDVTYSKVGYYPQTVSTTLVNGILLTQDIQLVPIPQFGLNVNVFDLQTNTPIDNANVRLEASLITHEGVTNGIGQESFSLYYQETYKVTVGKWGHITSCEALNIDNSTSTITVYLDSGYYDDFMFDFGWTTAGDATSGHFVRDIPFGTSSGSNPGYDSNNDCGEYCYVTGNTASLDPNADDVVGGSVLLRSPVMDLTTYTEPYLNYSWYFYNYHGPFFPFDDTLLVTVSNGIVNDVVLQATGSDLSLFFDWHDESFKLSDYISITNTMQFVFQTSDYDPQVNITEAAIDHFYIAEETVLGIEGNSKGFLLYPNPANESIMVVTNEISSFFIISAIGQTVYAGEVIAGENKIDVSFLGDGIYYFRCGNDLKKLVITK